MTRFAFLFILISFVLPVLAAESVPNFHLVNQNGKAFQLHELKGNPVIVSFIFSRCPMEKMCPMTVSLNKKAASLLKKTKGLSKTRFLFVTLDPEHDTPEALLKFSKARNLDPKAFTLATGSSTAVSDLASEFNVIGFPSGDSTLISHNLKTVVLDSNLKVVKEFKDNEWEPKDIIRALETLPRS